MSMPWPQLARRYDLYQNKIQHAADSQVIDNDWGPSYGVIHSVMPVSELDVFSTVMTHAQGS